MKKESYSGKCFEACRKYGGWRNIIFSGDDIAYEYLEVYMRKNLKGYNNALIRKENSLISKYLSNMADGYILSRYLDAEKMSIEMQSVVNAIRLILKEELDLDRRRHG